jgi:glyoxylase-like metal-dependent hydrolase (beta-lactamase superfamily II)
MWRDSIEPVVASGQLDLVADDAVLAPGVHFVATPGHTEHHVSVRIDSDGQSALITGDVLHHPAQVGRPDWSSTFDVNPQLSAASRWHLLNRLAEEDVLVLGTAFPDPSAGRVHRRGDGFRLAPEPSL